MHLELSGIYSRDYGSRNRISLYNYAKCRSAPFGQSGIGLQMHRMICDLASIVTLREVLSTTSIPIVL